ncbi:pirin family protein [Streptomyces sp. NPDC054837]
MRCGAPVDEVRPTGTPRVDVLSARDVPLGGPRSMTVRRRLPQRDRTLIGAWCFADHYGPDPVADRGGMAVPPHPHTGLQTVTWLFGGEVEHRDTLGTHAVVRPGEINLMTGGYGIAHFQHYAPEPVRIQGAEIRVFLGSLAGEASPVRTFTPLLGAEIVLEPGMTITLSVDADFEHGVLVDSGDVRVADTLLHRAELGYVPPGADALTLTNESDGPARAILLGGTPFEEEIVMWWNFVGRTHEDIVKAREDWETSSDRYGTINGFPGGRLPAPALPNATIKPRRNPSRR